MTRKTRLLLLTLGIVFVTLMAFTINRYISSYGHAEIVFQVPDTQNLDATLDDKQLIVVNLKSAHKLRSGGHHLIVEKPGYKKFSANFSVEKGENVVINVVLKNTVSQTAVVATRQIENSLSGSLPSDFTIQQATYFYDNTWVVAKITTGDDNSAILVAKYINANPGWEIALGPGTLFGASDVSNLPKDVNSYMYKRNYVLQEGFDE